MRFLLGFLYVTCALAQSPSVPLIDPRGVVDYFNPAPAPATVARGGILQITGSNLGPALTIAAGKGTLPTSLATPAVQATLNGAPMPLFSVSASLVLAQVPYAAPLGIASIVVSVGGVTGPPAAVTIAATQPSIMTADGSGTGMFSGAATGDTVTLAVSGLGVTRPALADGALPPNAKAVPMTAVIAFIGGVRTTATATASTRNVGVFDVVLAVPPSAQPGDLIYLVSGVKASNAVVFQPLSAPVMQMMPIPTGSPAILSLATPDVAGSFIIPYAAKDSTGCYSTLWFDMVSQNSGALNPCLVASSRAAASPLILPPNSEVAGGLIGPPAGTAPAGVSGTLLIANADNDSTMTATLSGNASTLAAYTVNASFLAAVPGSPVQDDMINGLTGAVTTVNAPAAAGGGAPTSVNINGLTFIVTAPVVVAPGQYGLVATDSPVAPAQAVYAVVQSDGAVIASQPFPAGWLPLIPAKATAAAPAVLETARFDAAAKTAYLLSRAADASQDGFVTVPYDASAAPSVIPMPSGWFAASCSAAIKLTAVALTPQSVLPGSNVAETAFSNPCEASGFLALDLATQTVTAYPLGNDSEMDATTLANFNDFVYGTNLFRASANTLFVFDSAGSANYTINLPAGAPSFATVQSVPGTNWLLAEANIKIAGDAGFVQFDLGAGTATLFPVPQGFTSLALVDAFTATNKIAARGLSQGAYQLLLFDLLGNVTPVPNPDGVASFGPPQAAKNPMPVGNPKSNTIAAVAYDGSGNQLGILLVNVP